MNIFKFINVMKFIITLWTGFKPLNQYSSRFTVITCPFIETWPWSSKVIHWRQLKTFVLIPITREKIIDFLKINSKFKILKFSYVLNHNLPSGNHTVFIPFGMMDSVGSNICFPKDLQYVTASLYVNDCRYSLSLRFSL